MVPLPAFGVFLKRSSHDRRGLSVISSCHCRVELQGFVTVLHSFFEVLKSHLSQAPVSVDLGVGAVGLNQLVIGCQGFSEPVFLEGFVGLLPEDEGV